MIADGRDRAQQPGPEEEKVSQRNIPLYICFSESPLNESSLTCNHF